MIYNSQVNDTIDEIRQERVNFFMMVESPLSILNLRENIEFCFDKCHMLNLSGLIFGADDFLATIGLVCYKQGVLKLRQIKICFWLNQIL